MSRNVSIHDMQLLYSRSAGRCNKCRNPIWVESENGKKFINIGEMAHNKPYSNKGPRSERLEVGRYIIDKKNPDNTYSNLILLCRNDHKIIDNDLDFYTVEEIKKIKSDHEAWIESSLNKSCDISDIRVIEVIFKNFTNEIFLIFDALAQAPNKIHSDVMALEIIIIACKAFTPLFYPFRDKELQTLTYKWMTAFKDLSLELEPCRGMYSTDRNFNGFYELNPEASIPFAKPLLKKVELLITTLTEWVEYCRNEYNISNLLLT